MAYRFYILYIHADNVVPVNVSAHTITTVAMDPTTDMIYFATTVTFGIHRLNMSGKALLNLQPSSA